MSKDTFNEMIVLGQNEGKGKDGVNSVLSLMQDLRNFSAKLQKCIEDQVDPQLKNRVAALVAPVDKMYQDLASVASSGSLVQMQQQEAAPQVAKASKPPVMVTGIGKLS